MAKTPCVPDDLPPTQLDWRKLLPLVGRANAALARYDGMLQTLPDAGVLLSPITVNEAVLSSRIEGTQATLDEVLEYDAGMVAPEARRGDSRRSLQLSGRRSDGGSRPGRAPALSVAYQERAPTAHAGGTGPRTETPGAFRTDQNWIGRTGDAIERARFVPPSPLVLTQALEHWEAYLGREDEDPIILTAIAHAQFEILHPFKDGNGRIGRMLIPLLLYQRRALSRPMFYLSEHLEAHRDDYYDRLLAITDDGDWQGWVEFFVEAVTSQAEGNLGKVRQIRDLYEEMRHRFVEVTHSQFAPGAVDAFFARPIISATDFRTAAGFNTRVTASAMLRQLEAEGLIRRVREGAGPTPAIYALSRLINITEGRPVFR